MQVEAIGAYRDNQLITNVIVRSKEFDRNPLLALESVVWMLTVYEQLVSALESVMGDHGGTVAYSRDDERAELIRNLIAEARGQ